jgi:hypothetical protein
MWFFVAGLALAIIGAYAFQPKIQSQKPAGIDEIQVPTANDGREIPVVFGCRMVRGPNVVWYGDLSTQAIKAKGGK